MGLLRRQIIKNMYDFDHIGPLEKFYLANNFIISYNMTNNNKNKEYAK